MQSSSNIVPDTEMVNADQHPEAGPANGEVSRASTPLTIMSATEDPQPGGGSNKRKQSEEPLSASARTTRSRRQTPSKMSSSTAITTNSRKKGKSPAGPLSILVPPSNGQIPESSQHVISSKATSPALDSDLALAVDADSIRREAAAGYESRLRARQPGNGKRDGGQRMGISASGRDVRIGGSTRQAAQQSKKDKGKGKSDVQAKAEGRALVKEIEIPAVPAVFRAICKKIEEENPEQFRLPADVRKYFAGVATGADGEYVDSKETRTKIDWHLDCLSPPSTTMPSAGKKWMCPNHPDHVMPRRRTLQENLQTIEVVGRGQSNNGNIEIANDSDGSDTSEMEFEDTIINRKKFRVPEKVIRLDFWEKLKKERDVVQTPVTVQEEMSADEQDAQRAIPPMEDLNAAAMMMALAFSRHTHHTPAIPPVSEPSGITSAPIQQIGESSSGPARAENEKSAIDTPPSKSNDVLKAVPFLSLRPTQSWTPAGSRFHNQRAGHAPSQSQPSPSTPSDSSKTSPKSPRPILQSSILSPTGADVTKSAQEASLPAMLPVPPSRSRFEPPSTIRFALPPKPQSVSSASMSQSSFGGRSWACGID
ncbi:nuclear protein [Cryptococcus deuterogattii 2001/935-1]|nr:nuclear protein [Cryptococcus deuterogattii 2001/935-1]